MQICRTIADIRAAVAAFRAAGESVGLVTTMGALHEGHMALMAEAKGGHDRVVATIFVNPTQFGEAADLAAYPRTEAADIEMLEAAGVDAVLIPEPGEIYPEHDETIVETPRLASIGHGAVRPGHFRGVTTVVARLFNIVLPDAAYFGEKDYQQLAVIRRMTRDLHFPLAIRGVATVRAPDGLALSSRNARLAPEDRAAAPVLKRALDAGAALARPGVAVADIAAAMRDVVAAEPRARLEQLDIVDPNSFLPATGPLTHPVGVMISARFGPAADPVLLIDQMELAP
ncbi:pantoate--beta-alanine ligase [Oceanicola granulosus HTCC2516]|uniref:Pantothenate synthetase n=1 Tax=Oceanicola granulosus (strain ATCC BAA-861 / DSM 15982 / KCTC 12143 / HTCC2516) TaxID=314256 RepID=Q2CDZ2_OCEGH|nr:pantoate--beta-alanine ligase [Oceanicola granulosus]EAR50946.1 pantoate--beta-alanine ligase [Oceanicola granulosus HTCC2516]